MCFLAGPRGKFLRVERVNIRGVCFGPTRRSFFLCGDGKLGVRFAIRRKSAAGIAQSRLALAVRIDSGSDLTLLDCQVTGTPDRPGSLFRGESGGLIDKTFHAAIALLSGHWQEARILRLAVGKRERRFDRGAERVFIDAIGRGARGSAVNDRADGNRQPMLGDVLVNGVVGETRQRVRNFVHVNFRLFGSCGFRQTKNRVDDAPKLALVKKLRGS